MHQAGPHPPLGRVSARSGRPRLAGRQAEIETLRTALQQVNGGCGRVVAVCGEAGIGKTRLLDEVAMDARRQMMLVLRGECFEGGTGGAYAPFRTAIDSYVAEASEATLREQLGNAAGVIARLVPRVLARCPDVGEPPHLQPDEERARLLDAVSHLLVAIAARAPLVVVVDDLHWADEDTVTLFRHLARHVGGHRMLLLGAYRDEEVATEGFLARAISVLRRERGFERIALAGLTATEVDSLLREAAERRSTAWSAGPVDAVLTKTLAEETKGNPFFLHSLLFHLEDEGRLQVEEGCWRATTPIEDVVLPDGIRQLLQRRIGRLSSTAQQLLAVGAAVGATFRFDVVAAAGADEEALALTALDEALDAQLIEAADGLDGYVFVHALVRQTLYEALNPSRRLRLHRRIAEAMERIHAGDAATHAAEIARQFHASRSLPGSERGVAYAASAADRAAASAAHHEAAALTRMALEMLPDGDDRRPEIQRRLGTALVWALRFEEALPHLRDAGDALAAQGGPHAAADLFADAAQAMSVAGAPRSAWVLAEHGLAFVGDRRDRTWVQLMALDISRREAEDVRHPGIPVDTAERREVAAVVARLSFSPSERLMLAGNGFHNPRSRADAIANFLDDVAWVANYDLRAHGIPQISRCLTDSEEQGRIADQAMYAGMLSRAYTAMGDLGRARKFMEKGALAVARLDRSSVQVLMLKAAQYEWCLLRDEGFDELARSERGALERLPEDNWAFANIQSAAARMFARRGMVDGAMAMLKGTLPCIEHAPCWTPNYQAVICDASEVLWLLQRTDDIEIFERNLREKVIGPGFRYHMRDGDLSLAHLCALQHRYEEAIDCFSRARLSLEEQEARPLRAIADFDEGLMYARRRQSGDAERARPLVEAALTRFREIDMPGWISQAEDLLKTISELDGATAVAATPPGSLPGRLSGVFVKEGDFWRVSFGEREVRLKHGRGLAFLAQLLRQPGRPIPCTELIADGPRRRRTGDDDATRSSLGDAGEILDATARAAYKRRLDELGAEIDEADERNDIGRAESLRHEQEHLTVELARAVGLDGRPRRAGSHSERARVNVTRAVSLALRHIAAEHPRLARHLVHTIHTGTLCVYSPDPLAEPIEWRAEARPSARSEFPAGATAAKTPA